MIVEAVGIEQAAARREFPLVLGVEREGEGAAFGDASFGRRQDFRPGRVKVRFRMMETQSLARAHPEPTSAVLANAADHGTRQTFLDTALNPTGRRETMQPAVRRHPEAVISAAGKIVDVIESHANQRPVAPVEGPQSVRCGAPDPTVRRLGKEQCRLRRCLTGREKGLPLAAAVTGDAEFTAQPQVAIPGLERGQQRAAQRRSGLGALQRTETIAIVRFEAVFRLAPVWVGTLDTGEAIAEQSEKPDLSVTAFRGGRHHVATGWTKPE